MKRSGLYTADANVLIEIPEVFVARIVLGFAANRIQFAVLREALYLVEQGVFYLYNAL